MLEREVTEEDLKKEDVEVLKNRTEQLYQLIEFDPKNAQIYQNEIVEKNIRLVPHVLKKYKPFGEDEFQLGCLGLIVATKSFDPSRGVPFSSYACFCIERELHKAHKAYTDSFEGSWQGGFVSFDEPGVLANGDEVNLHDQVPDAMAEEEFEQLLQEYSLDDLFERVIQPVIDNVSGTTKGQVTKFDPEEWRSLELQYILEMADIDSQKARLSLSTIAKRLDVSTQNIRMRHQRVIHQIKEKCIEHGYLKEA